MDRNRTVDVVAVKPAYSADGTPGYFDTGTEVPAQMLNLITEELRNLVVACGGTPSAVDDTQLATFFAAFLANGFFSTSLGIGGTSGAPKVLLDGTGVGYLELAEAFFTSACTVNGDFIVAQGSNKPIITLTGGNTLAANGTVLLWQASTMADADSKYFAQVHYNTSTHAGRPQVTDVYYSAGSVYVRLDNSHSSAAMDADCTIDVFIVGKAPV